MELREEGQMFCCIHAIQLILAVVLSLVVVSWSHCICLIDTQVNTLVNKVKPKRISCGLLRITSFVFRLLSLYLLSVSLPPPPHTGFHLSFAACLWASILFMSAILFLTDAEYMFSLLFYL